MGSSVQVLVVEGDTLQRTILLDFLRDQDHFAVGVGSAEEALSLMESSFFDVAVVEASLPGRSGIALLGDMGERRMRTQVVVTAQSPTVAMAVDCIRNRAADLLVQPVKKERLLQSVCNAAEKGRKIIQTEIRERGENLFEELDEDSLVNLIVETVCDALRADESTLMLRDSDGRLFVAASTSLAPEIRAAVRLDLGERIAGRVAADRQPAFLAEQVGDDPRFSGVQGHGHVSSSIVYPLVYRGELQGVLTMGRRRGSQPFRSLDMEWAAEMAKATSRALHGAASTRLTESKTKPMA